MEVGFFAGIGWLMLFAMGMPVPIGCPPREPDPVLSHWAPEQCQIFLHSTGRAPLSPEADPTQAWMAQREIQDFAEKLSKVLDQGFGLDAPMSWTELDVLAFRVARASLDQPFTLAITNLDMPPNDFGPLLLDGYFVIRLEEHAEPIDQLLQRAVEQGSADVEQRGDQRWWTVDRRGKQRFGFVRWDDFLAIVFGDSLAEPFTMPAHPQRPEWLAAIWRDSELPRIGTVSYCDIRALKALSGEELGDDFGFDLPWFHTDALTTFSGTTGLDEHGFVGRWAIGLDEARRRANDAQLLEPIPPQFLTEIPADVTGCMVTRIPPRLLVEWITALGTVDMGLELEETDSRWLNDFLGFDVEAELLPTLGDFAFLYGQVNLLAPTSGWMTAIRIDDSMSFPALFEQINLRVARWAEENGLDFSEGKAGEVTIYSLNVPSFVFPAETVCWCYANDYLLVSLEKGTISKHLRARNRRESVRDVTAVARIYSDAETWHLPAPIAITHVDIASAIGWAIPSLQMMAGNEEIVPGTQFTLRDLPSVESLVRGLEPSTTAMFSTPRGLEIVQRQTMPGTSPLVVVGMGFATFSLSTERVEAQPAVFESVNNMRLLALAMHQYHDTYDRFPAAANINEDQQPLLSWRVHLLPFLGESDLYDEFHLDEPWDSEHNLQLLERMPACYAHPTLELEPGKTAYLGVVGPDAALVTTDNARMPPRGVRVADITDGLSNTALFVEVNRDHAVFWTQPADFDSQAEGELLARLIGNWHDGQVNIALCDGSVWSNVGLTEETLRKILTRAGNERVDLWEFLPRAEFEREMIID